MGPEPDPVPGNRMGPEPSRTVPGGEMGPGNDHNNVPGTCMGLERPTNVRRGVERESRPEPVA